MPQNLVPKVLGRQTCPIRRIRTHAPLQMMQGNRNRPDDAATSVVPTARCRMPGQEPCQQ
ncbi:MAG TPA: hypothetical protein DEP82_04655 [Arthrobacter bacterium]|nr:hypothetical protein [Arthrobacter sp.]